jgi:hypothetical protein
MDNASDYESEDCRFESCQDRYVFFQGMKGNCGRTEQGGSCPNGKVDAAYLWDITVKVSRARDDGGDGHVEDKPLRHDHHLHHHHKEQGQQLVHLQIQETDKLKLLRIKNV